MIRKRQKGYYANGTSGQYWVDFSPKPKYIHRREYEKCQNYNKNIFIRHMIYGIENIMY